MKKLVIICLLFAVILIAGCAQYGGKTNTPSSQNPAELVQEQPSTTTETTDAEQTSNIIEITAAGFNPSEITVKAGETVTFVNKNTEMHWPASAVHPIHAVYPETGGCMGSKFDACKGLTQGESWSFTFNEIGTWGYHDHLNPSLRGTIEVQ